MKEAQSHTIMIEGKKHKWFVERLWELSKELEVFEYEISSFSGFDEDCWFGDRLKPTIRAVMDHHHKIQNANFNHPIIISDSGLIMDGIHRICRASLEGRKSIPAVKFTKNPEPDLIF